MAWNNPKLSPWGPWPTRILRQLQVFPLFYRSGIIQYVPRENGRMATIRAWDLYIHKVVKVGAEFLVVLTLQFLTRF